MSIYKTITRIKTRIKAKAKANANAKRSLSTLLALVMLFAPFAAMPLAVSAFTLDRAPAPPTIENITNLLNNYKHSGSGRLSATASGNTITVTGNVVNAKETVYIKFPQGCTVVWKANYQGTASKDRDYLVELHKYYDVNNSFVIEGKIEATDCNAVGADHISVLVHGGTVSCEGGYHAISAYGSFVHVTGETARVFSEYGIAIFAHECANRGVVIDGGQVYSGHNTAVGMVAINAFESKISINGGFVYSPMSYADDPGASVLGLYGAISANKLTYIKVDDNAVVCGARLMGIGAKEFAYGSTEYIRSIPEGKVTWTYGGLDYGDGIFPIPWITVYTPCTVTFETNGGSAVAPVTLKKNTKLPKPSNPKKDGNVFVAWYMDKELTQEYDFDSQDVSSDFTLYAKWVDNAVLNPSFQIAENRLLITNALKITDAQLTILRNSRTVTFETNGGSQINDQTVLEGKKVVKPDNPVKPLADFMGWYLDEALTQEYDFNTDITIDITLYAKWATKQIVTFNSTGGSPVEFEVDGMMAPYQIVPTGGTLIKPADPTLSGLEFAGWYVDLEDADPYEFSSPVTSDFTLNAKWIPLASGDGAEAGAEPGASSASAMSNFVQSKTYTSGMFDDVDEYEWYGYNQYKSIANAYEYGLMIGDSATIFNPVGNMTIAEAITVAARVNSIYATGTESFAQEAIWYNPYVNYAIINGIILPNDFTDYNRAATRAEMAYIFSRALPAFEYDDQNIVNSLPDVGGGTPYYSEIFMLYRSGVVTGNDDIGTFSPNSNITRAEAAAIITRVILPDTRTSEKTY